MPVSPQIWRFLRDDDEMADAGLDRALTPRTDICLDRLVGLDGCHDLVIEARKIARERHGVTLRCEGLGRWHGSMVGRDAVNATTVRR